MKGILGGACIVACGINVASAAIVYNNGSPLVPENGYQVNTQVLADDFQIPSAGIVNGASVPIMVQVGTNFGLANLGGWDGSLQWQILAATPNTPLSTTKPGTVVASGSGVSIVPTFLYQTGSGSLIKQFYNFDFSFGQSVPIAANTTYWFSLHMNQGFGQNYMFWQQNNTINGDHLAAQTNGVGNWFIQNSDVSFQLVPAPSAALPLLGLGAFGLTRRRR